MRVGEEMRGVVLPGDRRLELRRFPVPEPGHGQVLLRMRASALCGSDLRAIYRPAHHGRGPEAYTGVIAGHEPAGEVVAVGPGVTRLRVGERVAAYHITGCGLCPPCRAGWMLLCHSQARAAYGWKRDGGHADYMLAEESSLVVIPPGLSFLDGAMAACGLGTGYAACRRAAVTGSDTVLVTGLGPVGLGAAFLARDLFGARVLAVEPSATRRALAAQLGFEEVTGPDISLAMWVLERTAGTGCHVALECSGMAAARHFCLVAVGVWGRVVYVGEGGNVSFEPSPLLIHKQLTLQGSWVCSLPQMMELLRLLADRRLKPERMVTHKYPLEDAAEAYREFDGGSTGKVALVWE